MSSGFKICYSKATETGKQEDLALGQGTEYTMLDRKLCSENIVKPILSEYSPYSLFYRHMVLNPGHRKLLMRCEIFICLAEVLRVKSHGWLG